MSIDTTFYNCLVCGEDVLALTDQDTIPMCSTHSPSDMLKALARLERKLRKTRKQVNDAADDD
jgi:hypothetical protein